MKRQRKQKQDNLIEIPEEVRIPGTDVILEKGDKVEVSESSREQRQRINERVSLDIVVPINNFMQQNSQYDAYTMAAILADSIEDAILKNPTYANERREILSALASYLK